MKPLSPIRLQYLRSVTQCPMLCVSAVLVITYAAKVHKLECLDTSGGLSSVKDGNSVLKQGPAISIDNLE